MTEKEQKLLRLALCPSAADGEFQNAAVMLVKSWREAGATFESLFGYELKNKTPPREPHQQSRPYVLVFRFGKNKGVPLSSVDTGYLEWALKTLFRLSPDLKAAIKSELARRR